jgi:dipeptidyl aminopeptidase/acylaminoacyl peptidase
MSSTDRLERDLTAWLGDTAAPRTPDYLDDLIAQTAGMRQRPEWTFTERWLPMSVITLARQTFKPLPFRTIGLMAVLALLIAVAVAMLVGSRPRLPAPYGPAVNGLLAYADDGDIYTVHPVTIHITPVVTGPETDLRPRWALDGTHLVFEREAANQGHSQLFVVRSDGRDLTLVTPAALAGLEEYAFSPDGREVLFSSVHEGVPSMSIARSDGSGVRALEVGMTVSGMDYRPPIGAEIVFVGGTAESQATGLYAVRPDGSGLRTLVEPSTFVMAGPRWSSDGTHVAYTAWEADYNTGGSLARAYVVSADGQANRVVLPVPENDLNIAEGWSNDGTRLFVTGCHYSGPSAACEDATAIVPIDGNGPVVDVEVNASFHEADQRIHLWAPDDGSILTVRLDARGRVMSPSLLTDPVTGASRTSPWPGASEPSWQRLAP